jgi:PAS domain S-box-containing protein
MTVVTEVSSNLFRDLLEFAPDALIVVNTDGTIIYANSHAHTLFGYEANTMKGLGIENLIPQQSRAKHVTHRNAYSAEPRTREMGNRAMPLLGQRRDGTQFRAEIRLAPIQTPEGLVSAAAVRDATESERIVTMIEQAKETADEANATKSRFLAAASHDLRQPLQTLRLLNGTMKRLAAREPMMLEMLDQEDRALSTMSELLNALLNVSKLESGTVQPAISDVSLATVFDDMRQQFTSPARYKNVELHVSPCAVTVRTDSTLFSEMIQNLLANAIRYTDAGHVTLKCICDGGRTCVVIEDTGVGMSESIQEKIFDDFFQAAAHGARHRGGVGLGLGIVRRLSRMLELPVRVESKLGVGTKFTIDLSSVSTQSAAPALADQSVQTSNQRGRRILLVEDEHAMRIALKTYLQLDDHEVFLAASLTELDTVLASMGAPPDIVISDYRLGERERGSDAIARIRAKFGAGVPAIVLTGDTSLIPAQLGEQPATRMLNKPVDVQLLTATIDELLPA